MRSHTPWHISRCACKEKEPSSPLPTLLRQPLQIQQFPEWHSPQRQNVLVQMLFPVCRPRLKRRHITRHSSKVAIVQPIDDPIFLAQTSITLSVTATGLVRPQRQLCPLFWRLDPVLLGPARTHKEHVTDVDVATLALRTDVDALVFAALV